MLLVEGASDTSCYETVIVVSVCAFQPHIPLQQCSLVRIELRETFLRVFLASVVHDSPLDVAFIECLLSKRQHRPVQC